MEIPSKAIKEFRMCLEEPVAEELMSEYSPWAFIRVTDEDIKRFYAVHPRELDEALLCTMRVLDEEFDSPLADVLEVWFKKEFNPKAR